MRTTNNTKNKQNSTKQPPCATGVRLTRLIQCAALLTVVKLTALGWLWTIPEPVAQTVMPSPVVLRHALSVPVAHAADAATNQTAATSAENATTTPEASPVQDNRNRAAELDKRETDLRTLEQELDAKLKDLKAMEAQVQKLLDSAKALKDEKMLHLVDVYSNMKPKQAGQVLETLDENIAVNILAGMSGRKAGEILSAVSPAKAAKLSEALTKFQTGQDQK